MNPLLHWIDAYLARTPSGADREMLFTVPYNEQGIAIRLNVKGREHHGKVLASEVDAIREKVCAFLLGLKDAATGENVVEQVVELHRQEPGPKSDVLPDLLAIWSNGYPTKFVSSSFDGLNSQATHRLRPGNHTAEGFVLMSGEMPASAFDHAPSILAMAELISDFVQSAKSVVH